MIPLGGPLSTQGEFVNDIGTQDQGSFQFAADCNETGDNFLTAFSLSSRVSKRDDRTVDGADFRCGRRESGSVIRSDRRRWGEVRKYTIQYW